MRVALINLFDLISVYGLNTYFCKSVFYNNIFVYELHKIR
jgi:hypothetical protein